MTTYDEERLGELLRLLPPASPGWVEAAQELPQARADLDALVARAERDGAFGFYRSLTIFLRIARPVRRHQAPEVAGALRPHSDRG